MRTTPWPVLFFGLMACASTPRTPADPASAPAPGVVLADLTWQGAEKALTRDAVVVLPLGAAAKEHGPHLRLDNDLRMAEALAARVVRERAVVVAPALAYHHYPAFVDYPGSTTLREETARDLVVDIVRSLAHHGPRRFYALNTGISTRAPLAAAAEMLAKDGIVFRFTDLGDALRAAEKATLAQPAGTHADEGETSMMLVLAPERVDMTRAVRDIHERKSFRLTRDPNEAALYSPTGVYGDATLATVAKGEVLVAALLTRIFADLDALRALPLPEPSP